MKKLLLAAALGALATGTAQAQSADPLGRCLAAKTSAADRVTLVRWVFTGLASSKAVKDMAQIPEAKRVESIRAAGKLVERLLLRDCRAEAVVRLKGNPQALQASFGQLGERAMQDLMKDAEVVAVFAGVVQYLDMGQLTMLLAEGGAFGGQ